GTTGPTAPARRPVSILPRGFLAPDGGAVRFGGRSIVGLPPHAICRLGLARTFQITRTFVRMTALENVRVGALARHPRAPEALARAREVVERVGLGARAGRGAGRPPAAARARA